MWKTSHQELRRVLLTDTWRNACESQHELIVTGKDYLVISSVNISLMTDAVSISGPVLVTFLTNGVQ
jgi:hypothetical protein